MWMVRVTVAVAAAACFTTVAAQTRSLPPGPLQEKVRAACLPCHDARIMLQQRLDRRGWEKSIDKMIRWGAPVEASDRTAMIDYFAMHFGSGEPSEMTTKLPAGPGAEKVREACLGCHDVEVMAQERQDRRAWARTVDKMARWGAEVRPGDREAILNYLAAQFGPQQKPVIRER